MICIPLCKNCGEEIEAGDTFCPNCGARVEAEVLVKAKPIPKEVEVIKERTEVGVPAKAPLQVGNIMGIAGILTIIAAFGPWLTEMTVKSGTESATVQLKFMGYHVLSGFVIVAGLVMLGTAAADLGYIHVPKNVYPAYGISAICALVVLVSVFTTFAGLSDILTIYYTTQTGVTVSFSYGWGIWLAIVASLVCFYAVLRKIRLFVA